MEWIKEKTEAYFKIIWEYEVLEASKLSLKYFNTIWSKEEVKDLKDNYQYYIDHTEEAKIHFKRKWNIINKKAVDLGLLYDNWTPERLSVLKENYFYYLNHKKEAETYFRKRWDSIHIKAAELGITSMKINKKCSMFLGCHIAERILSHVFKDVQRMPNRNKGFDFICNKGHKIDSKASCSQKNNNYLFNINYNKIADYFLCIGFDNREDLNPQHIWLIKSDDVCESDKSKRMFRDIGCVRIKNTPEGLAKFSKYELVDKLKETIECCNVLKNVDDSNEVNIQSEIEK